MKLLKLTDNQKQYELALRQFTLDELLKCINDESVCFLFDNDSNMSGMKYVKVPVMHLQTKKQNIDEFIVSAWTLVDLAYYAVLATNDYRGRKPNKKELYVLCQNTDHIIDNKEKPYLDTIQKSPRLSFFLWGMSGEQFKMETPGTMFHKAARELYILFELSTREQSQVFMDIIQHERGVGWVPLVSTVFLAWFGFSHGYSLEQLKCMIRWDKGYTREDFDRVIGHYTTNYNEIRRSPLKRQIFYTKPFIKTQRGETVAVNSYLTLFLYEHSVLWTIRDYYKADKSGAFFHLFGSLFESYFQDLLETYVEPTYYSRIKENKIEERADWKVELCGYSFLVEQKSGLLGLGAKQQECNYMDVEKFVINNIVKALRQLVKTEEGLADKKYIKVVLLYEDYLIPEILDAVFELPECNVVNDHCFWIATIDEMEKLLYVYKNNQSLCRKIIEEKIKCENKTTTDGRRLQILLTKHKIIKNKHLELEKIHSFEAQMMDFLRRRLPAK